MFLERAERKWPRELGGALRSELGILCVGVGERGTTFRGGMLEWSPLFLCRGAECTMTEGEDIHSIVRTISLAQFLPLLKVTQAPEPLLRLLCGGVPGC